MGLTVNTTPGDHLITGGKMATPGWYHANITQLKETEKCDGIEVHGAVLGGKPDDTANTDFVDATFKFTLWYPDMSKPEEQQARNNAKLTALLISTDLITPAQLGQPISVNEQDAIGRQVLVHLCWARKKDGTKNSKTGKDNWVDNPPYVDLAYNDLLHIDDPDGANIPKNVSAMKFVPAQCRHLDSKYFAFKAKPSAASSSGNAVGGGSHATAGSTAAAGAPAKAF